MRVTDVFSVGEKTIFVGDLKAAVRYIDTTKCKVMIDGAEAGSIEINGEVLGAGGHRDLWTKSSVSVTRDMVRACDVWLIAA